MPELPEVETVARGLRNRLLNKRIQKVRITGFSVFRRKKVNFPQKVEGRVVRQILRRGKFLFFQFESENGKKNRLMVHLGMTGRLEWMASERLQAPHTHLIFDFENLPGELRFRDPRRFGWLEMVEDRDFRFSAPDALDSSDEEIFDRFRARQGKMKRVLLDQKTVMGLGNIYVDEILFRVGLHPQFPIEKCPDALLRRLIRVMKLSLAASVNRGGTSFRDYVNVEGKKGNFLAELKVYGRQGQPCSCGELIQKMVEAGRGTHFCPGCQPRKRGKKALVAMSAVN